MKAALKHIEYPEPLDTQTLLASTIHDMKNSLAMLIHAVEFMVPNGERLPSDLQSHYGQFKLQSQAVNDQMLQLLAMYKINQSQYMLNIDQHYLQDFLYEALIQHREICLLRHLDLEVSCEDKNLSWFFDATLINGVINNAMNNCYKYGGSKIHLAVDIEDNYLVIRIMDNGNGFPDTMLLDPGKIKAINLKHGGTGLGLYFAETCARLHTNKGRTGKMVLANNKTGGSCVTLYLP